LISRFWWGSVLLSRYPQAAQGALLFVEEKAQLTSIDRIAEGPEPSTTGQRLLSSPDGAVTLMLSDIADAASFEQSAGPERWERLLHDWRALVEEVVTGFAGEVGKFDRDGFFASFNSAHAGLHAAVELQRACRELGLDGRDVCPRVGVHSGFVIPKPDQPQGRNMVLAARIATQAGAGEILVSSSLKEYTQRDPRFRFEERGEHHFKGLVGEHTVYSVAWR
jgi:adenylate cyclase